VRRQIRDILLIDSLPFALQQHHHLLVVAELLLGYLQRLNAWQILRKDLQNIRLEAQPHQSRDRNADHQKQDDDEPVPMKHPATLKPTRRSTTLLWVDVAHHLV
jgi:hypothetical protein